MSKPGSPRARPVHMQTPLEEPPVSVITRDRYTNQTISDTETRERGETSSRSEKPRAPQLETASDKMQLLWNDFKAAPRIVKREVEHLLTTDPGKLRKTFRDDSPDPGDARRDGTRDARSSKRTASQAFEDTESDLDSTPPAQGNSNTDLSKMVSAMGQACMFQLDSGPIYGRLSGAAHRFNKCEVTIDTGGSPQGKANIRHAPLIGLWIKTNKEICFAQWSFEAFRNGEWQISKLGHNTVIREDPYSPRRPAVIEDNFKGQTNLLGNMICLEFTTNHVNSCHLERGWKDLFAERYHESISRIFTTQNGVRHMRVWFMLPQFPKGVQQHCLDPLIDIMDRRVKPFASFRDCRNQPFFVNKANRRVQARRRRSQTPDKKRSRRVASITAQYSEKDQAGPSFPEPRRALNSEMDRHPAYLADHAQTSRRKDWDQKASPSGNMPSPAFLLRYADTSAAESYQKEPKSVSSYNVDAVEASRRPSSTTIEGFTSSLPDMADVGHVRTSTPATAVGASSMTTGDASQQEGDQEPFASTEREDFVFPIESSTPRLPMNFGAQSPAHPGAGNLPEFRTKSRLKKDKP